jgi:group I intron endonuclease
MLIYKLTNLSNGKLYIGQTINTWEQRKRTYNTAIKNKTNKQRIVNALRKYGWEGFKVELIDKASTLEELNALEERYIAEYNTVKDGYNTTNGGDNFECTDAHKQILKDAWTDERRAAASERMKEQNKRTKGSREENISLGLKEYYKEFKKTDEFWKKNAKLQRGAKEWKEKNSIATTRKFILENRDGEEIEVVNLQAWCREEGRPDVCNLMGNYKRQKGWAKGWRIKVKGERIKPSRIK